MNKVDNIIDVHNALGEALEAQDVEQVKEIIKEVSGWTMPSVAKDALMYLLQSAQRVLEEMDDMSQGCPP